MEEDFFKVGYSTYLQKQKVNTKWRTSFLEKIFKHKVITITVLTLALCIGMNMWLVYRFMTLLARI